MDASSEKLPNPTTPVVIISRNPNSGAFDTRAKVQALDEALAKHGFIVRQLTDIDQVVAEVEAYSISGHQDVDGRLVAVVAAGGDGTVSLLANRLPASTPIAIMPLGTENLLAKHLTIKSDPQLVAKMIVEERSISIDAGRANGKLFLVMASCGFDADVVERLHSNRKGHIRHWSYTLPIIRSIWNYRYPEIRVLVDGQPTDQPIRWGFVFNVPRYAMNLPIKADADAHDGRLDLVTFSGGGLIRGLYYMFTVLIRRHLTWATGRTETFTRLRLESDQPVPFQLDGDPGGHLPLEIEVLPQFLRLIVPKDFPAVD